jgi:hypothetical protein
MAGEPTRAPSDAQPASYTALVGLGVLGLSVAAWVGVALWQGTQIHWPKIYDDAYYYFQIAENLSAGHGPTQDRLTTTNGFHPLWMLLLVVVQWVVRGDPETFLFAVRALCVLSLAASAMLLFSLCRREIGLLPALFAVLALLFPRYQNAIQGGIEATLVAPLVLGIFHETLRSGALHRDTPRLRDAWTGTLLGLLMLSRLDAVFVLLAVALGLGLRAALPGETTWSARVRRGIVKELALLWPVPLLVLPYLAWNLLAFGSPMPTSGQLKSGFPVPELRLASLRLEFAALLPVIAAALPIGARVLPREKRRLLLPLGLLGLGCALHALWHLLFTRWGVYTWYFALYLPPGLIALAILVRSLESYAPRLVGPALAMAVLASIPAFALSISRAPQGMQSGAAETAAWVRANLPPDAILGMKDSGAFTFFSRRRVMNMDGLANHPAYMRALCAGRLAQFLREYGVRYIVQHQLVGLDYRRYRQVYRCRGFPGSDGVLEFDREQEIFRTGITWIAPGEPIQGAIWRFE